MRNIMLKLFFISIIFTALFLSCGVETYQPIINLSAPMGLTAIKSNSSIFLQFTALNDENYFTGYYIYIALTPDNLVQNRSFIVPNSEGTTNKPTIFNVPPMSSAQVFSYFVNYYTNNTTIGPLQPGTTYFFFVKAYSEQYNAYSDPCNITNVTF